MKSHVKKYIGMFSKDINEDAEVYSVDKSSPYDQIKNRTRNEDELEYSKKKIENDLQKELELYWDNKKKLESAIESAKKKLEDNHRKMMESFDKAVDELDAIGVRINNGKLKLEKLVIYMSEPERMYELTDEAKLFVYKILKESYSKQTEACEEFLRATGAISDIMEYREFGVSYDKEKEGGRYKEPSFWHEHKKELDPRYLRESINEGLFTKSMLYLTYIWHSVISMISSTKNKVNEFERSVERLEKVLKAQ